MADSTTLGPYGVTLDPRGVRLSREGEQRISAMGGGGLRAMLCFSITESGSQPEAFHIERMEPKNDESIELHGFTTEQVALYAHLKYREDLEGIEVVTNVVNATEEVTARLGVHFELVGQADPKWLIPGLFYGENRVRDCQRMYPAWSEIQRDPARFLSNHWNFRSDRSAMPAVFCMTYVMTAFLFTEEVFGATEERPSGQGISAIGISAEEGCPQLSVHAPYVENPVKFSYCHEHKTQSEETFARLDKNEPLVLRTILGFRPYREEEDQPWSSIYRVLQQDLWFSHSRRPRLSSIEAERLALKGMLRWHYDEKNAMIHETSAFDKHFGRLGHNYERTHMHTGWTSGVLPAYTLLWNGRETMNGELVQKGLTVLDHITAELTPCGTLWPLITLEEGNTAGLGPADGLAHSGTIGEAVLFLLRSFRLELEASTAHNQWFSAIRSNLNFILTKQRDDGALPAYWDVESGEVYSYNGAAGMCWIAALAGFDSVVSSDVYRRAACAAGEYYSQFVDESFINGCVEDLPLVPTAADCHWAVISYMVLYECDHEARWLDLARRAANLAFTWRMAYNTIFQPWTMLARSGFQTCGADISSVAAPHLTSAGLISMAEMRKLSALTGDPYFEQRALEGRSYASQLLVRADGEYNGRVGHALNQVFHTDWWQPKGMALSLSYAITHAHVLYAEMVERTLVIPVAAMTGDRDSIVEAVSRSGLTLRESHIELPDSVGVRRQRDTRGDWESSEEDWPSRAEEAASGALAPIREKPPTRIIGSAPREINFTPLPWETQGEPAAPTVPKPKERRSDMPGRLDELPRKQFARQTSSEVPQLAKGGAWEILSADDEDAPTARPTPPPSDVTTRSEKTTGGLHTPLPDDDDDIRRSEALFSKPLLDPPTPAEKGLSPGKKRPDTELPPPPEELGTDLLADLMEEPEQDAVNTPLEDVEVSPEISFSLDEAEEDFSKSRDEEEPESEESDIRWKIF